jgi:hypothetical protein
MTQANESTFTDLAGRTWTFPPISVIDAKRCRDALGVDLNRLDSQDVQGLIQLLSDPITLVDVFSVLLEAEIEEAGLDDQAFGKAFDMDTVERARDAFLNVWVAYLPKSRREVLSTMLAKARDVDAQLEQQLPESLEAIEALDPQQLAERVFQQAQQPEQPVESASTTEG